jgi:hypothetical protein
MIAAMEPNRPGTRKPASTNRRPHPAQQARRFVGVASVASMVALTGYLAGQTQPTKSTAASSVGNFTAAATPAKQGTNTPAATATTATPATHPITTSQGS